MTQTLAEDGNGAPAEQGSKGELVDPNIYECTFSRACREQELVEEGIWKGLLMCNADFQCGGQRKMKVSP